MMNIQKSTMQPVSVIVTRTQGVANEYAALRGTDRSLESILVEHGHLYTEHAKRTKYPKRLRTPRACFANCIALALTEGLTYVEGLATGMSMIDIHHAWCVDDDGRIYDPTWLNRPGSEYFGVAFDAAYIRERYVSLERYGYLGSLFYVGDDDYALLKGKETRAWKNVTSGG